MRQFVPIKKNKKTKKQKAISKIQRDRIIEEERKERVFSKASLLLLMLQIKKEQTKKQN